MRLRDRTDKLGEDYQPRLWLVIGGLVLVVAYILYFVAANGVGLLISGMTAAADKLSLLYSAQSVSYSMPWIAQDAGLFRKHDLDVKLVYAQSNERL